MSFIQFSQTASTIIKESAISDEDPITDVLRQLRPHGKTSFIAALDEVLHLLRDCSLELAPFVFFLSDGGCPIDGIADRVTELVRSYPYVEIQTLKFGKGSDNDALELIADCGHGFFSQGIDMADIESRFNMVRRWTPSISDHNLRLKVFNKHFE